MNANNDSHTPNFTTKLLNSKMPQANKILHDRDKFDKLMEQFERKLTKIPRIGDKLSDLPTLVEMLKMWFKKTYPQIPAGTVLTIIAALVYFVSPLDVIVDVIPFVGMIDDIAVLSASIKYLVADDIKEFKEWRKNTFAEEELFVTE